MKNKPVIKWTGSKRSQADRILSHFPLEINTYYEPFIGGGSVMFSLLHSEIKVEKIICSDKNQDLIKLWLSIKNSPDHLIENYKKMWLEMFSLGNINKRKEYFYEVRLRFNQERDSADFLFLSRTCTNGLIRYNSKGDFNTSLHFSRDGILPETLSKILLYWSKKINKKNVIFIHSDYSVVESNIDDVVYLDPPYANTKGIYYGKIDYNKMWEWLREQKGRYFLSFDGKRGDTNNTFLVPPDIYSEHLYLKSGRSSFKDLKCQKVEMVEESLYIK
jgi:DNA adenine methylase